MSKKPTYEELELRIQELEAEVLSIKESEKALKKSYKYFQTFLNHTSDYILISDYEGFPVTYNVLYEQEIYKALGIEMKPGLKPHTLLQDKKMVDYWNQLHQRVLNGEKFTAEYSHKFKEEGTKHYEIYYTPIIENDTIKGFTEITRDITNRKQAEESALESEAKIRGIFQAAPIGIGVVTNRVFQDINERFCEISGYSRDELIGQSTRITYATDEDYEYIGSVKYSMIEEKGTGYVETRLKHKDGKIIDVLLSSSPLDPTDLSVGVTFTVLDITDSKRAEEALRESKDTIDRIFEFAPDWIGVANANEGYFKLVNPAMEKMLGYPIEEFLSRPFIDFIHPDDQNTTIQEIDGQQSGKTVSGFVNRYRCKDGSYRTIEWHATPAQADGTVYAVGRDITEHKLAEEALQESEERYRSLFENSPVGIGVSDSDGNIVDFNDAMLKPGGYSREDIRLLNNMTELYYNPEQRKEIISTALQNGFIDNMEVQFNRRDGTPHNCILSLRPIRFYGRNCWQAVVQDIEELKQAEKALSESNLWLNNIFDSLEEMVLVVTTDRRVINVNKACEKIFGYTMNDLSNISTEILHVDKEHYMEFGRKIQQAFDKGKPANFEFEAKRKNGEVFPTEHTVSQLNSDDGEYLGMVSIVRDISESKKLEEEKQRLEDDLKKAYKMEALGTLSGGIAHEFNNILGIIIGNTELAIDDVPEWNPAKDCLEEIRTASLRAKDVVRQILSFARKTPAARKPIRIRTIVQDSLKLLRATIPTNIEIQQEILCESEMILANPTEINQILLNLCSNSIHAIEEETGVLNVRLETSIMDNRLSAQYEGLTSGEYVKLTVKDNGVGIDSKTLDRIFDPYFTTKDVDKGLGMGLAIVYGLVKKHDGAIKVTSKAGKGTKVEVLFPVTLEQPDIIEQEPNDQPTGTERILFVDDEPSMVKLVTRILELQGYEVVGKTSSIEALKLFQEEPGNFDLVITDMAMPEIPGDRLALSLIKIRQTIPIIVCTGHSDRLDENRAKKLGIKAYTMKPFVKRDLFKTIRKVLDEAKRSAQQ
jgi:PAS domain S-box-containing protein